MGRRVIAIAVWLVLCAALGGTLGSWLLDDSWVEGAVKMSAIGLATWVALEIRGRATGGRTPGQGDQ
ncbi:hypothetical protein [Streptomyces ureilyticus]|uniref:Uncharacterized protein n=1 Tax=Streptomyces ureilyticus TaxID=1775131 RepID=A0ABX0DZW8_9ACTN|nr:hypothetical protein [Streptomyces ureilyticus]NGO46469.1 hypothetical protein [Streptomyces ureilyticus]